MVVQTVVVVKITIADKENALGAWLVMSGVNPSANGACVIHKEMSRDVMIRPTLSSPKW